MKREPLWLGPGAVYPSMFTQLYVMRGQWTSKRKPRRAAAAAAAAAASLPPGVSLTAASTSVGSARGWHERTGRRFVGDGDDCDTLGKKGRGGFSHPRTAKLQKWRWHREQSYAFLPHLNVIMQWQHVNNSWEWWFSWSLWLQSSTSRIRGVLLSRYQ